MILGYDETEKIQILRDASTITKPSMREKIIHDIETVVEPKFITKIFRENITRLLNNTYLFIPKGDRRGLYRKILLHRMVFDIEVWEGIGGEITLNMTDFTYQFVKGRSEMVQILKDYANEVVGTELGGDIIIRNYKSFYHQKKIVMEYANVDEEYKVNTFEVADII